jgi:hypothetical protein
MAPKNRRASSRSKSGSTADKKSLTGASERSNNTADTGAASRAEDVNDILNYDAGASSKIRTSTVVTSRATYAAVDNDTFDVTAATAAVAPTAAPARAANATVAGFDADALLRLLSDDAPKTTKTNVGATSNASNAVENDRSTSNATNFTAPTAKQIPVDVGSNGSNDGDAAAPEYSFMFLGKDKEKDGAAATRYATSVADVGSPGSVAGGSSSDAVMAQARQAQRSMELRKEALRAAGVDVDVGEGSAGSGSVWRSAAGTRTATVPPVYPTTPQQPSASASVGGERSRYETIYEPYSPGSVERPTRSYGGAATRSESSSDSRLRVQYQQGDAEEIQSLKDHRQGNLLRLIGELANTYLTKLTGFKVVPTYPLNKRITRCVIGEGLSV